MVILCSKCGERFESVIVDRDLAIKELSTTSTDHVRRKHRETFELLAKGIQKVSIAVATFMHFDECVTVPEEEKYILEKLDEVQELVMMAVGFDPDEIEEDEEEEEGEIEEQPNIGTIELPEEQDATKES